MTSPPRTAVQRLASLCDGVLERLDDPLVANDVAGIRARLSDPLRIVAAGAVGSGRSTLLQAIEAGTPGAASPPSASIGPVDAAGIAWREVRFDGTGEANLVLGETPGNAVFLDRASLFYADTTRPAAGIIPMADAVLYVFAHRPPGDPRLVAPLLDPAACSSSPIAALAVLNRADEIGGGRRDALEAARRVAQRYADDPQVAARCNGVVAVAGRLAAHAPTLREADLATFRSLLSLPAEELAVVVLSPEHFLAGSVPVDLEARRALLGRLGLFGVRTALRALQARPDLGHSALSLALVGDSGLASVLDHVRAWLRRAPDLKAGAAFDGLRVVQRRVSATLPATAEWLGVVLDAVEETELAIAERTVLDRVHRRTLRLNDAEVDEIRSLILLEAPTARLRQPPGTPTDQLSAVALGAAARWDVLATSPVAGRPMAHTCATLASLYRQLAESLGNARRFRATVMIDRDSLPTGPKPLVDD